jgi:hypothetical protein
MSQTIQLWTKSKAHARQLADITTELEVTTCWCGIPVGVPANLVRYARNYADQEIYCPLGHSFVFGDTNEAKLKRERDRAARVQAQLDQANAAEKAQRAAKTRFRNERDKLRTRAAAGVCPCCGRTFKQLARHMQSKHPDWPEA